MDGNGPVPPRAQRRSHRSVLIVGVMIMLALITVAVIVGLTVLHPQDTPPNTPAPSAMPSKSPPVAGAPTSAELARLQEVLSSGSVERLAPYLGASPDKIDPAFAAKVATLGIQFDNAPAKLTASGMYEKQAHDKGGNRWRIGLHSYDSQLLLVYAGPE